MSIAAVSQSESASARGNEAAKSFCTEPAPDATPPVLIAPRPAASAAAPLVLTDLDEGEELDATAFFTALIDRYRHIGLYEDTTSVVQIIEEDGAEPQRMQTELNCEINAAGELQVRTPSSGYLGVIGDVLPFRISEDIRSTELNYALWLAPHLSFVFDDEPLQRGRRTPVEPVKAEARSIDNRTMVQLRLSSQTETASAKPKRSACSNQPTNDDEATFDLFVNPESMLIERIESDERLPDGRQQRTTVEIMPRQPISNDDASVSLTHAEPSVQTPPNAHVHASQASPQKNCVSDASSQCTAPPAMEESETNSPTRRCK